MKENKKRNNKKVKESKNKSKKPMKTVDLFGFGGQPSNLFSFNSFSPSKDSTSSSNTSLTISAEDMCREILQNEDNEKILFLHSELKKAQSKKSLRIHLPNSWSKSECHAFGNTLKEIGITASTTTFFNIKSEYIIDYDLITPLKKVIKEIIKENHILTPNKETKITKRQSVQNNNKSLSLSLQINNNNNNNNSVYNDDNYVNEIMPPPSAKSSAIKRKSNNISHDSDKVIKKSNSMKFCDLLSIFINKKIITIEGDDDNVIIVKETVDEIRKYLNKKTINELKEFISSYCKNDENINTDNNIKIRKSTLVDNIINFLLDSLPINKNNNNNNNNSERSSISSSDSILLNKDMKENIPELNIINNNNNNNEEVFIRPSISLSLSSTSFDKKIENENEISSTSDSSDDSFLKSLNNSINNTTINNNEEMEIEEDNYVEKEKEDKVNISVDEMMEESTPSSNNISFEINNNIENTELLRKDIHPRPSYMNYSPKLNDEETNREMTVNNSIDDDDKIENDRSSTDNNNIAMSGRSRSNNNRNSNSLSLESYSPESDKDLTFIYSNNNNNNNSNIIRNNNSLINSKNKIFERKRMSILSLSPKFSLTNKSYEAVKKLSRISMFISNESLNNRNSLKMQNSIVDKNNLSVVLSESDRSSLLSTSSSFIEKSEIIKETPNKEEKEKENENKELMLEEEDNEETESEKEESIRKENNINEDNNNESLIPISPEILTNIFKYLPYKDIINNTLYVSKQWNRISQKTLSWIAGTNIINNLDNSPYILSNYNELWKLYPWGRYLSYGGFKEVYKVYNTVHNRYEALSIMNINSIVELNNEIVIEQEILCGFAVSEIVSMRDCEHFVEIYQVFQFKYNAPIHLWGSNDNKTPQGNEYNNNISNKNNKKNKGKKSKKNNNNNNNIKPEEGIYQYTRMEYCDIGDLEEYIKTLPDERMTLEDTIISMFQMTVSLYKAKKMCNLRHYDIKLLNFFGKSYKSEENDKIGVHWIYNKDENNHFEWKKDDVNIILKLADYGTSQIDEESLYKPINIGNFTTIENLPIEYFINGNKCIEDYSCDIWELGLSFLHLLTGKSPYEEILESVKCPKLLIKRLRSIINRDENYSVLSEVMNGDEDEICLTTLYRIIVLFGLPNEDETNPIISEILETIKKNKKMKEEFNKNRENFSFEFGDNYYICRARERVKEIENGYEILMRMFEYDSNKRIKIEELIESSIFNSLKRRIDIDEKYEIKSYCL